MTVSHVAVGFKKPQHLIAIALLDGGGSSITGWEGVPPPDGKCGQGQPSISSSSANRRGGPA